MRKYKILILLLLIIQRISAQDSRVIKMTPELIEAQFLDQNLELIAEKMNIDIADASIIQAKLWENPSFELGDVNLWTTKAQRNTEELSPIIGKSLRTQFSLELSQLIQTARKRGKLINREKVSKEIAIQDFEDVLRGLKLELRTSIQEIIYLQNYQKILQHQEDLLKGLIQAYKNQVQQGNIAKNELVRLQSSLLEISNELYEVKTEFNEQQKTLKTLLNFQPEVSIEIEETTEKLLKDPQNIHLEQLLQNALENRADVKKANLQIDYSDKDLIYEKAQRVPDITFSANYDRASGVWKDYVGFGLSFDLPLLNKNQGNIKAAQFAKKQSEFMAVQQMNLAQHELVEAYNNYEETYKLSKEIEKEDLTKDLDFMIDAYTRNLKNRNISMVEYMDFMEAYKENKQTMLTINKNMFIQFENLQYAAGVELK